MASDRPPSTQYMAEVPPAPIIQITYVKQWANYQGSRPVPNADGLVAIPPPPADLVGYAGKIYCVRRGWHPGMFLCW